MRGQESHSGSPQVPVRAHGDTEKRSPRKPALSLHIQLRVHGHRLQGSSTRSPHKLETLEGKETGVPDTTVWHDRVAHTRLHFPGW